MSSNVKIADKEQIQDAVLTYPELYIRFRGSRTQILLLLSRLKKRF